MQIDSKNHPHYYITTVDSQGEGLHVMCDYNIDVDILIEIEI